MAESKTIFRGPAYGGPLAGVDIEHDSEHKEIWVLGKHVGNYDFLDDQWLWSPIDAN